MHSTRAEQIDLLSNTQTVWDVLVIGGGASGLGIALDACTRGYKTLLVEQSDFAKGTSSRSTKLVHGGVRYLAQGDVAMVRDASHERGLLLHNAPHLVKDQKFIVPVYSLWSRIKYSIGLKLYDRIAGKLRFGPSVFITKNEVLKAFPGIKPQGLKGGVLYHDGQFDDSRLAINLAQTIWEKGGFAINYAKVTGLQKNEKGKIAGAKIQDTETGKNYLISAKAVVNATGVFVDEILQMDKPGNPKSICVSQGIHVVLDRKFFPANDALMIPETSDGRVLFALPWHDKVLVGTTDTPVQETSLEPNALQKEIDFILETAGAYMISKPGRKDVLSVFAGLRPLAAPAKGSQSTKEISRSHKITVTASGLFTILGGKWTTYRKMGEDLVNRIEKELRWPHKNCITKDLFIHGYEVVPEATDPFSFYGSDAARLTRSINGTAGEWLSIELKLHKMQVIWAVHNEMARTVEDVLSRRMRGLFLNAFESVKVAPAVAAIMAVELKQNKQWESEQVIAFNKTAAHYMI